MFVYEMGPGLALKPLELGDVEDLFGLIDQSRGHLRSYLAFVDLTKAIEDTRSFVEKAVRDNADRKAFTVVIMVDDKVAGLVGFNQINWSNKNAEIGYWLGESFVRRGVMTKAVRVLVDHAFERMDLNRVEIRAATGNLASRGVAEKLAFVHEGTIREKEWVNDRFVDHEIYGMLKRDWQMN